MNKKLLLLLTILFIPFMANAATANSSCTSKIINENKKLASNVKVSYDLIDNDGTSRIELKVYNIVDGVMVKIRKTKSNSKNYTSNDIYVAPYDTEDGVYTIIHTEIDDIFKYEVQILPTNGCGGTLKTITKTLPKYNSYSELEECQYSDVQDYVYCQKWVTTKLDSNIATAIDKINKYRANAVKTKTTSAEEAEEDESDDYDRLMRIWVYLIIGLSTGIVCDIVLVIYLHKKLQDFMKFDIDY